MYAKVVTEMIEVGKKYDMLTVLVDLGQQPTKDGGRNRRFYLCRCDCGKELPIRADQLGKIHSCGCIKKITSAMNAEKIHKHKQSGTRLYGIWQGMLGRCRNPNDRRYHRYGGRGITVCEEWTAGFEAFQSWACANGYDEHLTIDRIDNDGNYEPDNCRWVDNRAQSRNRSNNVVIDGEHASDMARRLGMTTSALMGRYKIGDRGDMLTRPKGASSGRKRGENNTTAKITDDDAREIKRLLLKNVPQAEIARRFGVSKYLVFDIKRGRTWKHIQVDDTEVNG